ncbi:MAG: hypothetical protein IPH12_17095 [Saprospirales bacterium]|nr:hypothetical protein [Saprospirales bacterium]
MEPSQTNIFKNNGCIVFFIIMAFALFFIFKNSCGKNTTDSYLSENDLTSDVKNTLVVNTDSLEKERWNELESELNEFQLRDYIDGELTPMNGVGQLQFFAERVNKALDSGDSLLVERAIGWRSKLSKIQGHAYPQLRKAWAKTLGDKLWRDDIEIRNFGVGYDKIEFIGGTFAANRNIEAFQNELHLAFADMRFKRIQYKWYKGADEYTYFSVSSKSDSEL